MEVTVQQTAAGHTSHAVVLPDILVMTAVISKVIHTVYRIFLPESIFESYLVNEMNLSFQVIKNSEG